MTPERASRDRRPTLRQACADARDVISAWVQDGKVKADDQAFNLITSLREALQRGKCE